MKILLLILTLLIHPAFAALPLKPLDPMKYDHPIRVACVGDSITQGPNGTASYPAQLQKLLGEDWTVSNFGVSGRTVLRKGDNPYWNEKAYLQALAFQPDAVIIMLGTNDSKPENWIHKAEFVIDYTDLIKSFLDLPSKPRVYICRPTPVPEPGNFGITEPVVQDIIKIVDRLAETEKVSLIDMHAPLENKPELLPDRVHPNQAGYAVMAETACLALTGQKVGPRSTMVRANSVFLDHAVLQRGVPLTVWGTGPDNTPVSVAFAGQKISTVVSKGQWSVRLLPLKASTTPQTMVISSPARNNAIKDILVGDVWVASGQSNMERQLGPRGGQQELVNWREEAVSANHPLIRQYYVPQKATVSPVSDVMGLWTVCTPETAPDFTAVGYYFARNLSKATGIPIGIIHSSWGGTPAETWVSAAGLRTLPEYQNITGPWENRTSTVSPAEEKAAWFAKNDPGSAPGNGWEKPDASTTDWTSVELPNTSEYHGVVWFRRDIDVPLSAASQPAILHLGKIDDDDTTWVNGKLVGQNSDWNADRNYTLSPGVLKAGRNTIAVRLVNPSGNGGWISPAETLRLEVGGISIPLGGSWQTRQTANFDQGVAWYASTVVNENPNQPLVLFHSMIEPLLRFPIKGTIWYQGESNSTRWKQYRTLFPALIADWRKQWGIGNFPFLFVQIAPHNDMLPEIREAQFLTLAKAPNSAMTVTIDIGDANDIHPTRKEPVGERLALAARALAYGEKIEYSGPLYESMSVVGSKISLKFNHTGTGLIAKDGPLKGFTIAGADKNFVPAEAQIVGKTVVVSSPTVTAPTAVRYGWANAPDVNLFNKENLTASSFRTDVE